MTLNSNRFLILIGLALLLGACSSEVSEMADNGSREEIVSPVEKERVFKPREDVVLSAEEKAMSSLHNDFSFKLFREYENSLRNNTMEKNFYSFSVKRSSVSVDVGKRSGRYICKRHCKCVAARVLQCRGAECLQ